MRFHLLAATALFILCACGGKTETTGNNGTRGGTAGAMGAVFGAGSGSSTDPGTSSGSGASMPGATPVNDSCTKICDRIAGAGCMEKDCVTSCDETIVNASQCQAEFDDALRCYESAPIKCRPSSGDLSIIGCDMERELLEQCLSQTSVMVTNPAPPPMNSIPPQCVGAPVPPSGMPCAGGGSASGGGSPGSGGPPIMTCQTECYDAQNNVWTAACVGANCTCLFNAKPYCSCVSASPCSSCCPGL